MAILLATGGAHRQDAFDERIASGALGAKTAFPPQYGGPQRPFGRVVGRLDPVDGDEGPERRPDLQEFVGEDAVVAGARAFASGLLEQGA